MHRESDQKKKKVHLEEHIASLLFLLHMWQETKDS